MRSRLPSNELANELPGLIDLFVCSSSFEDRCLTVPETVPTERVRRALVFENRELPEMVDPNTRRLLDRFKPKAIRVTGSIHNPTDSADAMLDELTRFRHEGLAETALVDVTTFTRESLLILLRLLKMRRVSKRLIVAYASASEYSLGDPIGSKWLSRGVSQIRSVLGYPGELLASQRIHLVLLVGYEHDRASALIEKLEPYSVALGYGMPGNETVSEEREASSVYHLLVKRTADEYGPVESFEIFCDDPFRTRNALLNQVMNLQKKNIVIAPLNNKITTIGAGLTAFANESVQLCYSEALEYNYRSYSRPSGICYLFDLTEALWPDETMQKSSATPIGI